MGSQPIIDAAPKCPLCRDQRYIPSEDRETVVPCRCTKQKATDRALASSGLNSYERKVRLADFKPSLKTSSMYHCARQYLEEFPVICAGDSVNKGLAITGSVGIGKTMLVTAIANDLMARNLPVAFVPMPEFLAELRLAQFAEGGLKAEHKIAELSRIDVCIFDDVAREKPTEWVQSQYYRILDARCRNRLATLFTSNFNFEQIAYRLGDVAASRLYALTRDRQVHVEAEDYRIFGAKGGNPCAV